MSYICLFLSTPSARRATEIEASKLRPDEFLSTPSARRATHIASIRSYSFAISIHALREEGDPLRYDAPGCSGISIHALREEGDLSSPSSCCTS